MRSSPISPNCMTGLFRATLWRALGICLAAAFVPLAAEAQGSPGFRPDLVLVKPLAGADLSALNRLLGAQMAATFPAIGNLAVIRVPVGTTADSLISLYEQSGLVEYAEHDFYLHALNDPNDFY